MRSIWHLLILFAFALASSCTMSSNSNGEFKLLPVPAVEEFYGLSELYPDSIRFYRLADGVRRPVPEVFLEGLEETSKISGPQIIFIEDKSVVLGNEGYMLDISRDQVKIIGNKKAGRFYGFMTLLQLMDDAREQGIPLPRCHIEDAPELNYRAIHLDMKHHMMKTDYYYKLIDELARYKINAIIAEVEDKLAYERHPTVASEDALSKEEWIKLSEYANERFIEISPLVQGLGHASYILKHDKYRYLRDDPDSDWAFNPLLPETYEVQFDLYHDALEAMPDGDYLHVGGDEVHTTGRGSGMSELELQLIWLNKVCKFAEENDRIPIFWDDIPFKYAGLYDPMFNHSYTERQVDSLWDENEYILEEYLERFPKNCVYMRWNYSHPDTYGNRRAMQWYTENELEVMGATAGQTRWKLMPQNESNMENIRAFANIAIEMRDLNNFGFTLDDEETHGLLLTLWDDDSPHFELYKRGIAAFAEYTWSGDIRSKEEIKAAYRHRAYGSALAGEEYAFVDQLEKAVEWWNDALLKSNTRNFLRNFEDPAEEAVIDFPFSGQGDWTTEHSLRLQGATVAVRDCNRALDIIDSMKTKAVRNQYRLEVYEQVAKLVRFSGNAIFNMYMFDISMEGIEKQEALDNLKGLPEEFSLLREEFERVYAETRILHKPEGYILDQDHHYHMANQSLNFDWQFWAEIYFLERLENELKKLEE